MELKGRWILKNTTPFYNIFSLIPNYYYVTLISIIFMSICNKLAK